MNLTFGFLIFCGGTKRKPWFEMGRRIHGNFTWKLLAPVCLRENYWLRFVYVKTTGSGLFTCKLLAPVCLRENYWLWFVYVKTTGSGLFTWKLLGPVCLRENYWLRFVYVKTTGSDLFTHLSHMSIFILMRIPIHFYAS